MDKIQKALAKLYFALGEQKTRPHGSPEITGADAEYIAYLAIRDTGESIGKKYFAMGAAASFRKAAKPPRGKSSGIRKPAKLSPPGGKKQTRKAKKSLSDFDDFEEEDYEKEW